MAQLQYRKRIEPNRVEYYLIDGKTVITLREATFFHGSVQAFTEWSATKTIYENPEQIEGLIKITEEATQELFEQNFQGKMRLLHPLPNIPFGELDIDKEILAFKEQFKKDPDER